MDFPFLKKSLIPTSVLAGILILIAAEVYTAITDVPFFDTEFFGGNGYAFLEVITYHCLALGFIATSFKATGGKFGKKRANEIFNTGVTTVATYLLQGVLGMGFTILIVLLGKEFFEAAGLLLPFGYGQGPGQALNFGYMYEGYGFFGGRAFGLTIAGLGFLCASFGGVLHLTIFKKTRESAFHGRKGRNFVGRRGATERGNPHERRLG